MFMYEFVLKEKLTPGSQFDLLGKITVPEREFDNQKSRYEKYIEKRQQRYPNAEYVVLINKLDGLGNFIEVVQ